MWLLLALASSVFAALTSILAKIGIDGVNSNLATALRTAVVLVMAWGMVFLTGAQSGIGEISRKSWLFLILSGLATGGSWLCYYKALQLGEACKVVPVDKLSATIRRGVQGHPYRQAEYRHHHGAGGGHPKGAVHAQVHCRLRPYCRRYAADGAVKAVFLDKNGRPLYTFGILEQIA